METQQVSAEKRVWEPTLELSLENSKAFSGFAAPDIAEEKKFYSQTLGLNTSEEHGLLTFHLAGDNNVLFIRSTITCRQRSRIAVLVAGRIGFTS